MFPGLYWDSDIGNFTQEGPGPRQHPITDAMQEFMTYDSYLWRDEEGQYSVETDITGPLFFNPPNC